MMVTFHPSKNKDILIRIRTFLIDMFSEVVFMNSGYFDIDSFVHEMDSYNESMDRYEGLNTKCLKENKKVKASKSPSKRSDYDFDDLDDDPDF
jgi:hypothetical protein